MSINSSWLSLSVILEGCREEWQYALWKSLLRPAFIVNAVISLSSGHAVALLQNWTSINLFLHEPVQSLQYETVNSQTLELKEKDKPVLAVWPHSPECCITTSSTKFIILYQAVCWAAVLPYTVFFLVSLSELARWGGSEYICLNSFGLQHTPVGIPH